MAARKTLLDQVLATFAKHGRTPAEVMWVGVPANVQAAHPWGEPPEPFCMTWATFAETAARVEIFPPFHSGELDEDWDPTCSTGPGLRDEVLVFGLLGKGPSTWIMRHRTDGYFGNEYWEYIETPAPPFPWVDDSDEALCRMAEPDSFSAPVDGEWLAGDERAESDRLLWLEERSELRSWQWYKHADLRRGFWLYGVYFEGIEEDA